ELVGKRLRIDFTGDGDDANFCFPGMGGLAGAEDAWVQIDSVDGNRVTFSMTGTFKIYDEHGDGPVKSASAAGSAILHRESQVPTSTPRFRSANPCSSAARRPPAR